MKKIDTKSIINNDKLIGKYVYVIEFFCYHREEEYVYIKYIGKIINWNVIEIIKILHYYIKCNTESINRFRSINHTNKDIYLMDDYERNVLLI
jgi:hypothetical protein